MFPLFLSRRQAGEIFPRSGELAFAASFLHNLRTRYQKAAGEQRARILERGATGQSLAVNMQTKPTLKAWPTA